MKLSIFFCSWVWCDGILCYYGYIRAYCTISEWWTRRE